MEEFKWTPDMLIICAMENVYEYPVNFQVKSAERPGMKSEQWVRGFLINHDGERITPALVRFDARKMLWLGKSPLIPENIIIK